MSEVTDELWNPTAETMSVEEFRATIETPRLLRQLRHAWAGSEFWRDRFAASGIDAADFTDGFNLRDLPFVDKSDLLADQAEYPPFGRLVAVSHDDIRRVHRTSGTTSRPFLTLLTERDSESTIEAGARAFWCAGVRPSDTVVHCLSYCMWSGGLTDHLCLERTGATVIPFGVGNSRYLLELIQTVRPTCISCTPSYLPRLADLCRRELSIDPSTLSLQKALFGGEPGAQDAGFRESIEREWALEAVDANYGMSDVLSIFGSECRHRSGLHFHSQDILLPELIDPKTRDTLPLDPGAQGELVLTHLFREAQPLFRFRTHDVVKILGVGDCPCGRSGFRFAVLGRSDDMLIVKGVNLFPAAFGEYVSRYGDQLTGAYRVLLSDQEPRQSVKLKVEIRATVDTAQRDRLARELEGLIRGGLSVCVNVVWAEQGTFNDAEQKPRLVELTA